MIAPDSLITYPHPSWGPVTGRVLRILGDKALCQDLSPTGAREWWPIAGLRPSLFSGRALTLRNPWPFAVHHLDKGARGIGCENRPKPAPPWLVGPEAPLVAMHTGARHPNADDWSGVVAATERAGWEWERAAGRRWFRKGDAQVSCSLYDRMISLIPGLFRILSVDAPREGDLTGWRRPEDYGYRIDYRPLATPIYCPGPTPKPGKERSTNLGWWAVPDEHLATIEAACAAGAKS